MSTLSVRWKQNSVNRHVGYLLPGSLYMGFPGEPGAWHGIKISMPVL